MASRFRVFDQQIKELLSEPNNLGCIEIAKKILNTTDSKRKNTEVSSLGRYINRNKKHFLDQHEGIYNATNEVDVANRDVKHMWIKTKMFHLLFQTQTTSLKKSYYLKIYQIN